MAEIRKCDNYDEARELFAEYSKLKGAEVCFVLFENAIAYAKSLGNTKAVINTIPEIMPVGYQMYLRYGFAENFKDENGIVNLSLDL